MNGLIKKYSKINFCENECSCVDDIDDFDFRCDIHKNFDSKLNATKIETLLWGDLYYDHSKKNIIHKLVQKCLEICKMRMVNKDLISISDHYFLFIPVRDVKILHKDEQYNKLVIKKGTILTKDSLNCNYCNNTFSGELNLLVVNSLEHVENGYELIFSNRWIVGINTYFDHVDKNNNYYFIIGNICCADCIKDYKNNTQYQHSKEGSDWLGGSKSVEEFWEH